LLQTPRPLTGALPLDPTIAPQLNTVAPPLDVFIVCDWRKCSLVPSGCSCLRLLYKITVICCL